MCLARADLGRARAARAPTITSPEMPAGSPRVMRMFLIGFIAEVADYPRRRGSFHVNSVAGRPRHVPCLGVSSDQEMTMELADLNKDEQLALARLLEFVVMGTGPVPQDGEPETPSI